MPKPTWPVLWLLLSLSLLSACSPKTDAVRSELLVFGTLVQISVYPEPGPAGQARAERALDDVKRTFEQFHHEWHAWEKGGIVSKINQAIAHRQPIEVADSVRDFILKSQQLAQQSDYLFDPGIGQLIALWGFHGEHWQGPPPSEEQIRSWLQRRPSIADVYFDERVLHSRNADVQLDFGGNAKGLALDIAIDTLRQNGIRNAAVNIGGDLRIIGRKPNDQAWSVGIQNPKNPAEAIAKLTLSGDLSVVTSGTYQRYFDWQGKRYSHILNPNSGRPAGELASVTVVHADATTADAAATALLIAGPAHWPQIARKMGMKAVLVVDQQGRVQQTKAMEKYSKLL
jgi:thiamine biosynthesis lipoprotein